LFSRPVDPATITAANFALTAPAGVTAPTLQSFVVLDDGRRVQLTYDALPVATGYSFDIKAANITDLSGHALGTQDIVDQFNVTAAKYWVGGDIGDWSSGVNWSGGTVPLATDNVVMNLTAGSVATYTTDNVATAAATNLSVSGQGQFDLTSAAGPGGAAVDSAFTLSGDLTNSGNVDASASQLTIGGSLHNSGRLTVGNPTGASAQLQFSATHAAADGGGSIVLQGNTNVAAVYSNQDSISGSQSPSQGATVLENVDNTISGTGKIGLGGAQLTAGPALGQGDTFVNDATGLVHANGSDYIILDAANVINHGVIEATGGANVDVSFHPFVLNGQPGAVGAYANNRDGTFLADGQNSGVNFVSAYLDGGTVRTSNGGAVAFEKGKRLNANAAEDTTIDGTVVPVSLVGADAATLGTAFVLDETNVKGAIHNQDNINVDQFQSNAVFVANGALELTGDVTLDGGGQIALSRAGTALSHNADVGIVGDQPGIERTLTNVDNRIHGNGTIGVDANIVTEAGTPATRLAVVNEAAGVIEADRPASATDDPNAEQLDIVGVDLTNRGAIKATNTGGLFIDGSAINNAGGRITAENALANTLTIHNSSLTSGVVGAEGGTVVLDGATVTNTQIDAINGGVVQVKGSLDASTDTFTGTGATIEVAANASLIAAASTFGASPNTIQLDAGASVELSDGYAGNVVFQGSNGRAVLDNSTATTETFTNFVAGNTIDLKNLQAASLNFTVGGTDTATTLALSDGNGDAFNLAFTFATASGVVSNRGNVLFTFADDGHGGTLITDNVNANGGATINNNGTLVVGPGQQTPNIVLGGDTTLAGAGIVQLEGGSIESSPAVQSAGTSVNFTNKDNTIESVAGQTGVVGDANVNLDNKGVIESNGGTLTINSQNGNRNENQIIANGGSVTVTNDVDDWFGTGSVSATSGGTVKIDGQLHGLGTNSVDANSTFETGDWQDGTMWFKADNTTFIFDRSSDAGFSANQRFVKGFSRTDVLDLRDIDPTKATLGYSGDANSGTLTVSDGSHTASLVLLGNYLAQAGASSTAANFSAAADNHGGTAIMTTLTQPH
jgi:hypothetical protein